MEKYIFLDFDGVLNTSRGMFDKHAIDNLRRLVGRSDAKVIISSNWRLQGWEYMRQLWQQHHLPGEIVGITPSCNSIAFSEADGVDTWHSLYATKGLEIAEWLKLNAKEPYHYVILDDEEDILYSQREHFVKVDGSNGLSRADVRHSLNLLNAKEQNTVSRWLYHILQFFMVYILIQALFFAFIYWYPELGFDRVDNLMARFHECLVYHHHFPWQ